MIPELAEPTLRNARQSLGVMLAVSAVLIVPWGQALLRWRRHGDAVTAEAALSYRGWSIAFAIALVCLHLTCFGGYGLRLACGKVVAAEVQRTAQTRLGVRPGFYHRSRTADIGAAARLAQSAQNRLRRCAPPVK